MKLSGLFLIFGPLAVAIALIVYGSWEHSAIKYFGWAGLAGWVVFALWLATAMSYDVP